MKLFISNKQDMDLDLQHEAKDAHKLAYAELQYSLNVNTSIPLSMLVSNGRIDYFFSLEKVDIEKGLYIYLYNGSAVD